MAPAPFIAKWHTHCLCPTILAAATVDPRLTDPAFCFHCLNLKHSTHLILVLFFSWTKLWYFRFIEIYVQKYAYEFLSLSKKRILGYIYILYYKSANAATVLRYCTLRVFILCKHCSGNSTLVKNFASFFFFNLLFKFCTEATVPIGTVATVVAFFFLAFRLHFFLIYCYTDTINFIIFSRLLNCQLLISQNKIIKYKTVTNHNWR